MIMNIYNVLIWKIYDDTLKGSDILSCFFVIISFCIPSHFLNFGHRMGYADYREMNTSSLQNVSLFSVERNGEMLLMYYLYFR